MMTGVAPQPLTATEATVSDGGTGYSVGDILYAEGGIGTIPVQMTVATETGGVIDTVTIANIGSYTEAPPNPVATITTGSGADAEIDLTFTSPYQFWIHEDGQNEVVGQNEQPVLSFFETSDLTLPALSGVNRWLDVSIIEPDFVQSGPLSVQIRGRVNARAPEVNSDSMTIAEPQQGGLDADEEVTRFKTQRRQLRFYFESNSVGGFYQMGEVYAHVQPGDGRVTS